MPIRRRDLIAGAAGAAGLALFAGVDEAVAQAEAGAGPAPSSDILLDAPLSRWDSGLPLGNGMMGVMLWGEGTELRLSLDRQDLWHQPQSIEPPGPDFTYANLQKMVAAKDRRGINTVFTTPFQDQLTPTRVPAGRLTIDLREGQTLHAFHLSLPDAEARIDVGGGRRISAFVGAQESPGVLLLRIPGPLPEMKFTRPKFFSDLGGYPQPETGGRDRAIWLTQAGPKDSGLDYALLADSLRVGETTEIAVTIATFGDTVGGPDSRQKILDAGLERLTKALTAGYDAYRRPHADRWRSFWTSGPRVAIPDDRIQAQYDRTRYFYGASARADAPPSHRIAAPMALQGVWTDESGAAPPRHGEYRLDLSLPFSYTACAAQDLGGIGVACFAHFDEMRHPLEPWVSGYFGIDAGTIFPAEMTGQGVPVPGWPAEALSPTACAWLGALALRHARFSLGDVSFLRNTAYPLASSIATGLLALVKPDASGRLKLPLSSSPEYGGDTLASFVTPNSNWDRALLHALFSELAEAAKPSGHDRDLPHWQEALSKIEPPHRDAQTGALTIAEGVPYAQSSRHLGHAAAIYPFGEITVEGGPDDQKTVLATIDQIRKVGGDFWTGYTHAWFGLLHARAGHATPAFLEIDTFARAFVGRNGLHLGGDQSGQGISRLTNRTFSLEGNFLALELIQEILMQSWGGVVRVFPAANDNWLDVRFTGLRAESGLRVSATRKGGKTVLVRLAATRAGTFRLRNPFPAGAAPKWTRAGVRKAGDAFVVTLGAGESVEGRV